MQADEHLAESPQFDRDKVEAHYKNGVVNITLAKDKRGLSGDEKISIKAE